MPELVVPLSPTQSDLMAADHYWPGLSTNPRFTLMAATEVLGCVRPDALRAAVGALRRRYSNLRVRFERSEFGAWSQIVVDSDLDHDDLELRTLRSLATDPDERCRQARLEVASAGLDPRSGDVVRGFLVELGPEHFLFALVAHHLVVDGESVARLLAECWDLYHESPDESSPATDADPWIEYCRQADAAAHDPAQRERVLGYWRRFYDAHPPTLFPTQRRGGEEGQNLVGIAQATLERSTQDGLARGAAAGIPIASLLTLAALQTIARQCTSPDVRLYYLQSGRINSMTRKVRGPVFNLFPVAGSMDGTTTPLQQAADIQRQVLLANRYCTLPLHRRVELLDYVDLDLTGPGLCTLVFFQIMTEPSRRWHPHGSLDVRQLADPETKAGNWQSLGMEIIAVLSEEQDGRVLSRYDSERFDQDHVETLLGDIADNAAALAAGLVGEGAFR